MKKICILTSVHPPFDTRIFHKQAKSLVKAGYDVSLIAQHDKNEVVNGVKIVALPKAKNRFRRVLGTWRVFKLAFKQKADVYHFHDPELIPAGLLLKFLTKGKVIYDVHEYYGELMLLKYYLPRYTRKIVAQLVKLVERFASIFFDSVIAATDDLLKNFPQCEVTVAVYNFPILAQFDTMKRNTDSDNNFNVIYVGGLTEERGISEIVQAMEYVNASKDVKLVLYGKFVPEPYENEVRRLRGFERVEYRGWVEPDVLWLRMASADIGIVCLRPVGQHTKGLPTKLFEYMAAGLPVIASNFPLWQEIVEGNNCGLTVDPLNPQEIARAVVYLIEHPGEARKMGQNGRKAVLEKYNWENESRKLIALYHKLVEVRDFSNKESRHND